MRTVELVLLNTSGLHARPAALFVQAAGRHAARVTVENLDRGTQPVDAKSILMVLTAGVQRGHRIRVTADGPDEVTAIGAIAEAVRSGLGEPVEG
jgi:phosphotransferase system HPr (HPr) family protein